MSVTYSGCLGDQYTGLVPKLWCSKNTSQAFFFQLFFNKKYIEVAISYFTMQLIILKWLESRKETVAKQRQGVYF